MALAMSSDDYIPVESSFTSPNAEVSRLRSELHSIEILLGDILQRQSLLLSRLDALPPAAVPSIVDPALRVPFGDVSLGGPLSAWRAVVGRSGRGRSLPLFAPEEDDSPVPLHNFFAPLEMLSDTEPATEEQSNPRSRRNDPEPCRRTSDVFTSRPRCGGDRSSWPEAAQDVQGTRLVTNGFGEITFCNQSTVGPPTERVRGLDPHSIFPPRHPSVYNTAISHSQQCPLTADCTSRNHRTLGRHPCADHQKPPHPQCLFTVVEP
ncbi:unnamed protein product [Gadus morhua 'NCC']